MKFPVPAVVSRMAGALARVFKAAPSSLSGVNDRGGWISLIRESFMGAWQSNVEVRQDRVMAQTTVFACITLIASDIGKLRLKLMQQDPGGIWDEIASPAFSPVLRKQNRYQTRQKFIEQWLVSKLSHGNTYVLKERDNRGVVVGLYVLDPNRVKPLVAQDGSVYYQLQEDDISHVPEGLEAIPASEIIHDRMVCLFHPLVGVSPIFACGLAATQALKIQQNSAKFFENMSQPGGVLTAPGQISDTTAERIKKHWEANYAGNNSGKVAVVGDGLKYEAMAVNAVDAQLVEQLKMSAEQVCSVFHVPAYMVGAAPAPAHNNIEALQLQYYSQCLQALIDSAESCLDEGLGLVDVPGKTLGTEFELDDLLRMDQATLTESLAKLVAGSISTPNEARKRMNKPPLPGGDTIYMQQQNFSLDALNKRDTGADPFGKTPAAPAPESKPSTDAAAKASTETAALIVALTKGLEHV
jgi:HK97 family phage portal protein